MPIIIEKTKDKKRQKKTDEFVVQKTNEDDPKDTRVQLADGVLDILDFKVYRVSKPDFYTGVVTKSLLGEVFYVNEENSRLKEDSMGADNRSQNDSLRVEQLRQEQLRNRTTFGHDRNTILDKVAPIQDQLLKLKHGHSLGQYLKDPTIEDVLAYGINYVTINDHQLGDDFMKLEEAIVRHSSDRNRFEKVTPVKKKKPPLLSTHSGIPSDALANVQQQQGTGGHYPDPAHISNSNGGGGSGATKKATSLAAQLDNLMTQGTQSFLQQVTHDLRSVSAASTATTSRAKGGFNSSSRPSEPRNSREGGQKGHFAHRHHRKLMSPPSKKHDSPSRPVRSRQGNQTDAAPTSPAFPRTATAADVSESGSATIIDNESAVVPRPVQRSVSFNAEGAEQYSSKSNTPPAISFDEDEILSAITVSAMDFSVGQMSISESQSASRSPRMLFQHQIVLQNSSEEQLQESLKDGEELRPAAIATDVTEASADMDNKAPATGARFKNHRPNNAPSRRTAAPRMKQKVMYSNSSMKQVDERVVDGTVSSQTREALEAIKATQSLFKKSMGYTMEMFAKVKSRTETMQQAIGDKLNRAEDTGFRLVARGKHLHKQKVVLRKRAINACDERSLMRAVIMQQRLASFSQDGKASSNGRALGHNLLRDLEHMHSEAEGKTAAFFAARLIARSWFVAVVTKLRESMRRLNADISTLPISCLKFTILCKYLLQFNFDISREVMFTMMDNCIRSHDDHLRLITHQMLKLTRDGIGLLAVQFMSYFETRGIKPHPELLNEVHSESGLRSGATSALNSAMKSGRFFSRPPSVRVSEIDTSGKVQSFDFTQVSTATSSSDGIASTAVLVVGDSTEAAVADGVPSLPLLPQISEDTSYTSPDTEAPTEVIPKSKAGVVTEDEF